MTACAWDQEGVGPDVLLVHAGVADRRMWAPLRAALGPGLRTTAYDQRGFGATPAATAPYDAGDDLVAVLDAAGVGRAHVVGSSFGGLVALHAATRHPDRVTSLLLLAAPLPDHAWSAEVEAYAAREEAAAAAGDVEAYVAVNVAFWRSTRPDLVAAMVRRAAELGLGAEDLLADPEPDLASLRMPVTVAAGERDVADFAAIADRLAAEVPSAVHAGVLTGAGHLLPLDRPDAVAALVHDHLGRAGEEPALPG